MLKDFLKHLSCDTQVKGLPLPVLPVSPVELERKANG